MSFLQPWIGSIRKMSGNLDTSGQAASSQGSSQDIDGDIQYESKQVSKEQNNFNPKKKQRTRVQEFGAWSRNADT